MEKKEMPAEKIFAIPLGNSRNGKGGASTLLLLALLFCSWSVPQVAGASSDSTSIFHSQPRTFPFDRGERYSYQASWSGIPVARAELSMDPLWQGGRKFYQVVIRARTLRYLDLLWKMRDSIHSIFDANTLRPHRFVFSQRENSEKTWTEALYDSERDHWTVRLKKKRKLRHYRVDSENTLDPVTASYLVRSLDFKIGERIMLNVFVGGEKRYPLSLEIAAKERIAIQGGEWNAYKIVSRLTRLKKSGEPKEVREAILWVSADERKVLLKASSDLFIGALTMELVSSPLSGKNS